MSGSTLTDRYVQEVVRRIPADQRDDVAAELHTTIADTIDGRGPGARKSAEREVLTEMGDPIRLAARYADRPLALIGPELYPAYIRLLVVLLTIVLPLVTAALVVIDVFDHNDLRSAIGTGIGGVLTIGAQMIAWVTVIFALIERSRHRAEVARGADTWTPDDLPEARQPDKRSGAVASAAWSALVIGLIVWQHTARPYRVDGTGERLEVLDPQLWSGWIWPILAGLAGIVLLELVRGVGRRWTVPRAVAYAVAELVATLPLAWILYRQEFFNPAFLGQVNADWRVPDELYTVAALAVLVVGVASIGNRFRDARRRPAARR